MKTILLSIFVIVNAFHLSNAQTQGKVYEIFNDAVVNTYGNNITAPFCGGLNSYQIQHADLNNDSKKDLILFDQNNNLLKTFINIGTSGQVNYAYAPQYEKNFPIELTYNNYLILKDYNCDGIPDLFHNGTFGVTAYNLDRRASCAPLPPSPRARRSKLSTRSRPRPAWDTGTPR